MGKRIILFLFAVCCSATAVSCISPLERKLRELDDVLEERSAIQAEYDSKVPALIEAFSNAADDGERYAASENLFRHYRYYQMDSALLYLNLMSRYGDDSVQNDVSLLYTEILISLREYSRARRLLDAVDTVSIGDREKASYYHNYLLLYANMAVDEFLSREIREDALAKRHEARLKYISCGTIDQFEYVRRNAIQLYEDGNPKEAERALEELYGECTDVHHKEDAAYSLATAYLSEGDRKMAMLWFAQSAIHSQKEPNRVYLSLYELSMLLSEGRDLKRASNYVMIAMQDALDCKYSPRIFNSARFHLSIASAVEKQARKERVILALMSICLAALLSVVVVQNVRMRRQARKLQSTYRLLEVANKIKEGYVFKYITLSSEYLGMIEDFRHDLRSAMKSGDMEAIRTLLRDPHFNEEEYQKFYSVFDETFLGIFPDFVERVNELLEPEWRFTLGKEGRFPTGLRILAALRLGMSDSGKIADFLSCASSSVYTHRCKIKKHSLCGPEEFEKRIMEI